MDFVVFISILLRVFESSFVWCNSQVGLFFFGFFLIPNFTVVQQVLAVGINVLRLDVDNGSLCIFQWKQHGGRPDGSRRCIRSPGWKNILGCDSNVQGCLSEKIVCRIPNGNTCHYGCFSHSFSAYQAGRNFLSKSLVVTWFTDALWGMPGHELCRGDAGARMSYCFSRTNRKTHDLFMCSLTTWICSSVNWSYFPLGCLSVFNL